MANTFNFGAGGQAAAEAPAQAGTEARPPVGGRYAFGLPAGSIRAVLTFMVLGLVWGLMILQKEIPLYLQYLMFMILGHYFAAHHKSIKPVSERERSPLFLPRGVIRVIIFLGFAGVMGYLVFAHHDNLRGLADDLKMQDERTQSIYMPVLLVTGFFIGLIVARFGEMIGGDSQPGWYQDIQAWLVLMATLGLGVVVIITFVINPSLEAKGATLIQLPRHLDHILAAVVGFYFGARS
jgi:hypothetical protein